MQSDFEKSHPADCETTEQGIVELQEVDGSDNHRNTREQAMPTKIQKFEEISTKILAYLKDAFPFPCQIEASALGLKQSEDVYEDGDLVKREATEDEMYLAATFNFLRVNGYVSGHSPIGGTVVENALLSEKGLLKVGVKLNLEL
jgi:hypothetical protein